MILNENTKIKNWYQVNYPSDELGEEMNENVTFYQLFECLDNYKDVYDFLGVHDSTRDSENISTNMIFQIES